MNINHGGFFSNFSWQERQFHNLEYALISSFLWSTFFSHQIHIYTSSAQTFGQEQVNVFLFIASKDKNAF